MLRALEGLVDHKDNVACFGRPDYSAKQMIVGQMYQDLTDGIPFSQPGWFDTGKEFRVRVKPGTGISDSWRKCVRPGEALNVTFEPVRSGELLSYYKRGEVKRMFKSLHELPDPLEAFALAMALEHEDGAFRRPDPLRPPRREGYLRFWIRVSKTGLGMMQMTRDYRNPDYFITIDYYTVGDGEGVRSRRFSRDLALELVGPWRIGRVSRRAKLR